MPAASPTILIAAYNYYVVVRLLIQKGMRCVFVDIDPTTLTIDPDDLARKITPASKLVVVTHMFGIPADLETIKRICDDHGLLIRWAT